MILYARKKIIELELKTDFLKVKCIKRFCIAALLLQTAVRSDDPNAGHEPTAEAKVEARTKPGK